MRDYHRSPWFFILVAFSCFGAGYVVADDNRIDRETQQPTGCPAEQSLWILAEAMKNHKTGGEHESF